MIKIRLILTSVLLSLFLSIPAHAQEAFDIQNFQTDIEMHDDGTLSVTESIDTNFTQDRHGIYRDIQALGISINVTGVTDETGNAWQYSLEAFGEGIRVKIGDPNKLINGRQVYVIKYDVKRAIGFFDDHEELYWNATGNAWGTDIQKATATVKLPSKIKDDTGLMFKCYTGSTGSTSEDCSYKYDKGSNLVIFTSNNPLPAYNGFTIVVGVPKGTFPPPTTLEIKSNPTDAKIYLNEQLICSTNCTYDIDPGDYTLTVKKFGYSMPENRSLHIAQGTTSSESFELEMQIWYLALKLLIFLFFAAIGFEPVYTYWKKGRDPHSKGVLVPQYDPPDKLLPAEIGSLVDERVDMRDLTSTIIDLCVRGYLQIKVLPKAQGLIFKTDDYELIRLDKPKAGDRGLTDFEKLFIDKIFEGDQTKKISDLQNKFYTVLPKLDEAIYNNLVNKGYFPASPASVRGKYFVKAFIFIFFGFFLMSFEAAVFQSGFTYFLFLNGILTVIFAYFMPKKTPKGVEAKEHILGFKYYMEIAEKERIKFQEKENIFYEYLPFAMALNVADKWSNAFKDIYKEPPKWFVGYTGHFNPTSFTHSLNSVSSSISSSFASHPSSGGSGFSGGSGGGGGGGGGGSW